MAGSGLLPIVQSRVENTKRMGAADRFMVGAGLAYDVPAHWVTAPPSVHVWPAAGWLEPSPHVAEGGRDGFTIHQGTGTA